LNETGRERGEGRSNGFESKGRAVSVLRWDCGDCHSHTFHFLSWPALSRKPHSRLMR